MRKGNMRGMFFPLCLLILSLATFTTLPTTNAQTLTLSTVPSATGNGVGMWMSTTPYPTNVGGQSCAVYSGYVYCVGGVTAVGGVLTDAVYYASLGSSGVGTWARTADYPLNIVDQRCIIYGGYMYCVGGSSAGGTTDAVYYTSVGSGGAGGWVSTTPYPTSAYGVSCDAYSGYIYCLGGETTNGGLTGAAYYASLNNGGVGTWMSTTTNPITNSFRACPIYLGYMYCIGNGLASGGNFYASVGADGIGTWMTTTPYPTGAVEMSCVVYFGYVYCVSGFSGPGITPTSAVYYASLGSSGVGTWAGTSSYPISPYDLSCVAYSGYIYCVGGETNTGAGVTNAVYYAAISTPSTSCGPPTIYLGIPSINGYTVSLPQAVTLPGGSTCSILRIFFSWGDGSSGNSWFPAPHTYCSAGGYTITVTSYQSDGQTVSASTTVKPTGTGGCGLLGGAIVSVYYSSTAGLGFEETANVYDNSGVGFLLGHRSNTWVLFPFTDSTRVQQTEANAGELLFSDYGNAVVVGGPAANPTTAFYESQGLTPLRATVSGGNVLFESGGTTVYSVSLASLSSTNDYFIIQMFQYGGGHTVIVMYGINAPGTLASGVYAANFLFSNPGGYPNAAYIVHWQGTTPNLPLPSDTYTIVYP